MERTFGDDFAKGLHSMASPLKHLVALVRNIETGLSNGQFTLTLVSSVLAYLARDLSHPPALDSFQATTSTAKLDKYNQLKSYLDDLYYLEHVFDNLVSLCIIHGDGTLRGVISLQSFPSLRGLEIRRLPLHLLKGLSNFRGQLETVICTRSLQDISLLLQKCGGDATSFSLWPELKTLVCNDCDIELIGQSLELAPSLQNIDFRYNSNTLFVFSYLYHFSILVGILSSIAVTPF